MMYVLSLFVLHRFFFPCLRKVVVHDYGISWVSSLKSLRKHAYSNKLKFLPTKNENFQIKNYDIFHISAQNIDFRYSLVEAVLTSTHNLFLSRNKKNNVYPCKPQFYYIKVGFKGVKII